MLVLSSDTIPAGRITKWEWYASTTQSPGDFNKFRIKMCHTSLTAVTTTYANNYDGRTPVQVFYKDPVYINASPNTWFGFNFDTPFEYNGTDNFIFEVWWEGDNNGNAYTYWAARTGRYVYSYIKGTTPYFGYPNQGNVVNYLHNVRLTLTPNAPVAPTSLGRVKAIFN